MVQVSHRVGSSSLRAVAAVALLSSLLLINGGCNSTGGEKTKSVKMSCCTPKSSSETKPAAAADAAKPSKWKDLFDGKSLDGWKVTKFGGEVEPEIQEKELIILAGAVLNGITYTRELPKTNYEIEVEARRKQGSDFFVGLTFPVKDSHASLICGGWGGSLVGISSIDGMDASENNTGGSFTFEKDKWYTIRQRVTDNRLQSWIDDKQVVDTDITGRRIGVRIEVGPSKPMGIATYQTDAGIRAVRIRELSPDEVKAAAELAK